MKLFVKKNLPFLSILLIAALFIAPLIIADDFADFGDVDDFSDFGDVDDFADFGDVDDFADFGDVDDFADFGDVDDFSDSGDTGLGEPSSGDELEEFLDKEESDDKENTFEDSPFDSDWDEPPFANDDVPPIHEPFEAIMDFSITDSPDPVHPGDELIYTITYYNRGWDEATDVVIELDDDRDAPIEDSTPSANSGDNEWRIGTVKAREGGTITVKAIVDDDTEDNKMLAAKMSIKYYDKVYGYKHAEEIEFTRVRTGDSSSDSDDEEIGIKVLSTRFPAQVESGEPLFLTIRIENSGTESLEDVKVAAVSQEIGIRTSVGPFDLSKGSDETKTLLLDIPSGTPEGQYYLRFTITSDGNVRRVVYRDIEIVSTLE